jgi:hypothetical protein
MTITSPQYHTPHAAALEIAAVEAVSQRRCGRALDMLLTQRGDASAEVEALLADDPGCVFGHCLRVALIVRAESSASRLALRASAPRSRQHVRTPAIPRVVMQWPRALGSTAIRHMRSHFTAPS